MPDVVVNALVSSGSWGLVAAMAVSMVRLAVSWLKDRRQETRQAETAAVQHEDQSARTAMVMLDAQGKENDRLNKRLAERDRTIADLYAQLTERNRAMEKLQTAFADIQRQLSEAQAELARLRSH